MCIARGTLLSVLTFLLAAGCQVDVAYQGRLSCSEPPHTCPSGFYCSSGGECLDAQGDPPPTAGTPDAATDRPDADVGPGAADASPSDPDAGRPVDAPDASTGAAPFERTFGERPEATVHNVTQDTDLREDAPNSNNGHGNTVFIDAQPRNAGLIEFDLSSLPTTLHCVSAELVVNVNNSLESGEYQIFPVSEDWNQGQATWNERRNGVAWSTAGAGPGSRATTLMGRIAPRTTGDFTVSLDCTAISAWIASPASNHGMVWIVADSPDGRGGQFRSSENGDAATRPMLRLLVSP